MSVISSPYLIETFVGLHEGGSLPDAVHLIWITVAAPDGLPRAIWNSAPIRVLEVATVKIKTKANARHPIMGHNAAGKYSGTPALNGFTGRNHQWLVQ